MGKQTASVGQNGLVQAMLSPTSSSFEQTIKSFMAGGVATVFDYAVMLAVFISAHAPRTVAVAAGYTVGLVICYVASILWIFPHRTLNDKRVEFAVFTAIGLIGMGLTQLIIDLSLRLLHTQSVPLFPHLSSAAQLSVAKAVAIVIVFFYNFWARKAMLFRPRSARTAGE